MKNHQSQNSIQRDENQQPYQQTFESNAQTYHKLIKMKKVLLDTEKRMFNRIKLFQKTSEKILKKKQQDLKLFQKLQTIKRDPSFSRSINRPKSRQYQLYEPRTQNSRLTHTKTNKSSQLLQNSKNNIGQVQQVYEQRRILAQKTNQARLMNIKSVKQARQRNKIIIQQRKKRQLSRKLQSANIIRRQRENVKIVKEQCLQERKEEFKRHMDQKYYKERDQLMKLQIHLQDLHLKEKEALICWKKTVDN